MQHPALKVFIASALGALIGSLVGLQFTPSLWWIGLIVGGLVGYVCYEFDTIVRAIPVAATQARYLVNRTRTADYRPVGSAVINFFGILIVACIGIVGMIAACIAAGLLWSLPITALIAMHQPLTLFATVKANLAAGAFIGFFIWMSVMSAIGDQALRRISDRDLYTIVYFKASPLGILFYWLPRGIWATICGLFAVIDYLIIAVVFLALAAAKLFTLVHTDRRLLCGVDAALGAGVGMLAHNPLIGAVAGGLIGLADYELVSKRLLKVGATES